MTKSNCNAFSSIIPHSQIQILIISNLTSTPTQSNSKFTTIITKSSPLKTDTSLPPILQEDLIEYYDHMFPNLEMYCNFIDQKLKPWWHTLELKLFDSLYWHQWSTTNNQKTQRTSTEITSRSWLFTRTTIHIATTIGSTLNHYDLHGVKKTTSKPN